jgi:hypothetical protein
MSGGCLCGGLKSLFCKRKRRNFYVGTFKIVRRSRRRAYTQLLNGESWDKMAPDNKERPLSSSLSKPPKEEDTTVEKSGNMMDKLKILEEV